MLIPDPYFMPSFQLDDSSQPRLKKVRPTDYKKAHKKRIKRRKKNKNPKTHR